MFLVPFSSHEMIPSRCFVCTLEDGYYVKEEPGGHADEETKELCCNSFSIIIHAASPSTPFPPSRWGN